MPYQITLTNGTVLTTIADQTEDHTTSLTLIGRNYAAGYGGAVAENFVHLLENAANTSAPTSPLTGQMWYNTTTNTMQVWSGTSWNIVGFPAPTSDGLLLDSTFGVTGNGHGIVFVNPSNPTNQKKWLITCRNDPPYTGMLCFEALNDDGTVKNVVMALDSVNDVIQGVATSAEYADLAERYAASEPLLPGDLVEFGGHAEVRRSTARASSDVIGVVSTDPAFKMNALAGNDDTHPYIAQVGRVPCKVIGQASKFDYLIASEQPGVAEAVSPQKIKDFSPFSVFGRVLEDKYSTGIELVEIRVGIR